MGFGDRALVNLYPKALGGPLKLLVDGGLIGLAPQRPEASSLRGSEHDMVGAPTREGPALFALTATTVPAVFEPRSRDAWQKQLTQRRHGEWIVTTNAAVHKSGHTEIAAISRPFDCVGNT